MRMNETWIYHFPSESKRSFQPTESTAIGWNVLTPELREIMLMSSEWSVTPENPKICGNESVFWNVHK